MDTLPSLNTLLTSLRHSALSPHNRLRSIHQDATFVNEVSASFRGRPLVANERCGSWYVDPAKKGGSAYFKSTDGHAGVWGFSTRRLNLHLLGLIEGGDGCIIVDSTRRGKRMPDALSKTIPIWCTVLNMALFPSSPISQTLHTPPSVVPQTEHAQIVSRLPEMLASFLALRLDLEALRKQISKPLRPFWVTPETPLSALSLEPNEPLFEDARPVICCTASRRVDGADVAVSQGYVQGAGDDTENWARGLTPIVFWENLDLLLGAEDGAIDGVIDEVVAKARKAPTSSPTISVAPRIVVSALPGSLLSSPVDEDALAKLGAEPGECRIILLPAAPTDASTWVRSPSLLVACLGKSRTASRNLRHALPTICAFAARFLQRSTSEAISIATATTTATTANSTAETEERDPPLDGDKASCLHIQCESGRDLSVATALAINCLLFTTDGNLRPSGDRGVFTKASIRVRLGAVATAYPAGNPSRATLQSVNSFLMDGGV